MRRGDKTTRLNGMMMNIEDLLFAAQTTASDMASSVTSTSGGGGLGSLGVLYVAGLFTSFSPCSLGLLPLTMSYISSATGEREDKTALLPTIAYAAGLSSVFCGLGLSVALVGKSVFGSSGGGASYGTAVASSVAILMGCQLLNFLSLPLPSIELDIPGGNDDDDNKSSSNKLLEIFLLGGSSALVASPCATPVLTTLLAYVAASDTSNNNVTFGALLLLFYTFGYTTPLLLVGATGGQLLANLSNMSTQESSPLAIIGRSVTPITASILIWTGTNGILTALYGNPSLLALTPVLE
eukprot:CAMPEP_0197824152 /NCGR_PEP_ID=MMETSP1437-20131217/1459_1 /TAXON_ID=49252 ORGANISM="Eucampia antarctica, Strain CCMP1452" /NCGR_SAMPLE_ID=MMETSP1437 /ASSEMBLY_ACC=CAM_ASM_001096 /LENGTH=295 /DNA_ID=CAMNT_0043423685 /DNA_START=213 /DNA_END=1100 /DNA_ORIENTATION=+